MHDSPRKSTQFSQIQSTLNGLHLKWQNRYDSKKRKYIIKETIKVGACSALAAIVGEFFGGHRSAITCALAAGIATIVLSSAFLLRK